MLALPLIPARAEPAQGEDVIAKYEGTGTTSIRGYPAMTVKLELVGSGKRASLTIPNDEDKGAKGQKPAAPMPRKELADAVKKLTVGEIVKAGVAMSKDLGPTLTSIDAYEAKPGEATPNGYVFEKTFEKPTGKLTNTSVRLSKFGAEYTFSVPTKKGEKPGEIVEDPDIMAALGKLTEGSSVWVKAAGSKLVIIEPYNDPQNGKLGKVGTTEVEGSKVPSAEIEVEGGKTITVLVPGVQKGKMFVVDISVAGELRKLKAGAAVQFWSHEDGDKIWLRDIGPAPKVAAEPAPAPEKKTTKKKDKPAA